MTDTAKLHSALDQLLTAARMLIDQASSTYKARNGREVGIQADDGEKCWIVHSDDMNVLEIAEQVARQALSELNRDGADYVLVPREPTEAMWAAGRFEHNTDGGPKDIWSAMIDAALTTTNQGEG